MLTLQKKTGTVITQTSDKRKTGNRMRQQHRHRCLEVAPLGRVVAGPDGTDALRAGEERS